jgi:hypothetical protein
MLSLLGVLNAIVAIAFILAGRPDIRASLVDFLSRTISEMTFKKAVFTAAAVVVAILAVETLPFDLALPLFMDAFAYVDIVAAVGFALASRQGRAWARTVRDRLIPTCRKLMASSAALSRRLARRERRLSRMRIAMTSKSSKDGEGEWPAAWAYAV